MVLKFFTVYRGLLYMCKYLEFKITINVKANTKISKQEVKVI